MKPGKFVFLDRDGVINRDPHGYVTKWKNFRFIPNAKRAIRLLNANGFKIIVISNQGGISKGLFTKEKLDLITRNMLKSISNSGGRIHATWFCHHKLEDNCACKKPKIGLFKKATKNLKLNKKKTFFIGDSEVDVKAGKDFGLKTIFVLSGKGTKSMLNNFKRRPDFVCKDLLEASKVVIREFNG